MTTGDRVEWTNAYGGTEWGYVKRVADDGRVFVDIQSRRSAARTAKNEVYFLPSERHMLRAAGGEDGRDGE